MCLGAPFLFISLFSRTIAVYLVCKMLSDFNHKSECHWNHVIGEISLEVACLVGELSVVVYLTERTANLLPVDLALAGQVVLIAYVIVIVNVKRVEILVTKLANTVLRLKSHERSVTKIKASYKMLCSAKIVNVAD